MFFFTIAVPSVRWFLKEQQQKVTKQAGSLHERSLSVRLDVASNIRKSHVQVQRSLSSSKGTITLTHEL